MPDFLKTKKEFDDCISENPLVIVDFTAAWCGPCQNIAPKFVEFSEKYTSAKFVKVDVDDNADTAQSEDINAMPTFIVYKDGKKVDELCGANPAKLEELIKKYAE
eukprot:GGOE01013535.1.p1 GENE.GGOE01013535.1~~GGOE01013535.1.p1  ORF type:complete len:115 (-),score=33.43 GGOE01013535.1:139-453(-)